MHARLESLRTPLRRSARGSPLLRRTTRTERGIRPPQSTPIDGHGIAAAGLSLGLEAEPFEEVLHRLVEAIVEGADAMPVNAKLKELDAEKARLTAELGPRQTKDRCRIPRSP